MKHAPQPAPEQPSTRDDDRRETRRDGDTEDDSAPRNRKKDKASGDTAAMGGDEDGVAEGAPSGEPTKPKVSAMFAPDAEETGALALSPTVEGDEVSAYGVRSSLRFDVALGGGAAIVNGDGSFVQTTRIGVERGRRTLFGGEATLWLSRGVHAEGTVLGTISHRVAPHLELGGGVGLHVGSALGPALDLELRYHLPAPLWLYLRYDGALLFHDSTRDGQNTGTFGISAHF